MPVSVIAHTRARACVLHAYKEMITYHKPHQARGKNPKKFNRRPTTSTKTTAPTTTTTTTTTTSSNVRQNKENRPVQETPPALAAALALTGLTECADMSVLAAPAEGSTSVSASLGAGKDVLYQDNALLVSLRSQKERKKKKGRKKKRKKKKKGEKKEEEKEKEKGKEKIKKKESLKIK